MIETFAALFLAHVLADFVFQTRRMVDRKAHTPVLLLHTGIVLLMMFLTLGRVDTPAPYVIAASHLAIDAAKLRLPRGPGAFLADQAAHLLILVAASLGQPGLWQGGFWAELPFPATELPPLMLILGGAIFAIRGGDFATGLIVTSVAPRNPLPEEGLPGAGRMIGLLERGLAFTFILVGQFEAVGFLLAAKSILRFGAIREDRAASEYVLIGTLASFAWAILTAFAVRALLSVLTS
ncbi:MULTISPECIES: DUF3307 domain-containing protein [unclassified Haematobacter]|uniref:DUF3307 domain-containing protein n=1 Tax=unclassified Haematobacter TaxID=2640585 RepID=UPI0025BB0B46|nr:MULTISPECIES: DUF3307 domain-containing protein [unclassified Haematobacter]